MTSNQAQRVAKKLVEAILRLAETASGRELVFKGPIVDKYTGETQGVQARMVQWVRMELLKASVGAK